MYTLDSHTYKMYLTKTNISCNFWAKLEIPKIVFSRGKLGEKEVALRVIPRKYSERSNREVHALKISKNCKNILSMLFNVKIC